MIAKPLLAALSIVVAFGCVAAMAVAQLTDETVVGAMCRAHRPAHVTYGGLAALTRFERDHHIPLCLGGMDTRLNCNDSPYADQEPHTAECNVWYEPIEEALVKDVAEHNACRYACAAGPAAISKAREDFRLGNWRKWLEQ